MNAIVLNSHDLDHLDYEFCNKLFKIRKNAFRSRETFAEKIRVEAKTVGRWERGEICILHSSGDTILRVMNALGPDGEALIRAYAVRRDTMMAA